MTGCADVEEPEFKNNAPVVVGFGEVLWDNCEGRSSFGGAPANFACHAAAMGADAHLVSAVGDDVLGNKALTILRKKGVNADAVQRSCELPTGSVDVSVDSLGRPTYTINTHSAWDAIDWTPGLATLARQADAVCFGTLAQRSAGSRQTLARFLERTKPSCLRVFDVNLRGEFFDREIVEESLRRASVLKASDEELWVLSELFDLKGQGERERMRELISRFDLTWMILTCGPRGAVVVGADCEIGVDARRVRIHDTIGAGDSFSATMTVGLLLGCKLEPLVSHACLVAEYVCSQAGALPSLPESLVKLPIYEAGRI